MSYKNPSSKHSSRVVSALGLGIGAAAACFLAGPLLANPVNPVVVNGAASFNQAGKVLTVTNSNGAIINWDKFSIKAGETTRFIQPTASSTVLNRVLSDPTAIYGTLSSNGRVWLVNPAGIMVGAGGRVDVAGFVASTLNISNADFLAGRRLFANDGSAKDVINQGEIRTPSGGSVYLIGSNVGNEGIITTPKGETILAAGQTVSLIDSATPGVKVDITGAEGNATNLGQITAEAGRVGIAGVIVRNSGALNASSVVSKGGRVFLEASQDAYVDQDSRITATGTRGGKVEVLGNRVAVTDRAFINASGTQGGGQILVGGDYQGKNPEIKNARVTYFGKDAVLKADATGAGKGGKVIVWADDTTRAYGNIFARGGVKGGDGGFVETSGKRYLDVNGIGVDTRAAIGRAGTWLLDPTNIYIAVDQAAATAAVPAMSGTDSSVNITGPTLFQTGGAPLHSLLLTSTLQTALASNSVVEVNTTSGGGAAGDILVVSPVTWATANTLKLNATSSINLGANITGIAGQLSLYAGGGIQKTAGLIKVDKLEASAGGGVLLPGFNEIGTLAASATSGLIDVESALPAGLTIGSVGSTTGLTATASNIAVRQYSAGGITVDNDVTSGGTVLLGIASGAGGISFGGSGVTLSSPSSIQTYTSGGPITQTNPVTFSSPVSTVYATTGAITLNNIGNNFTGPLSIPSGGVVQIKDTNALALGPVTTTGNLTVVAAGALNPNGAINTNGNALDLTGSNITLVAAGNLTAGAGVINLASTGANANTSIPAGVALTGAAINIKSDNLDIIGTLAANTVSITRHNAGVEVDVGGIGTDTLGYLRIGQTEIDNITAQTYRFGDTSSTGGLRVAGPLVIPATKTLTLLTSNLGGSQMVQDSGATITASYLRAEGGGGVNLTDPSGNFVGALSGKTLSGDFRFRNQTSLDLATVDTQTGIDAAGNDVWLQVTGLLSNSGGAAPISANGLKVIASNHATLLGTNMVNKLAADMIAGTGSLTFRNGQALAIDTVDTVNGIQFGSNSSPIDIATTSGNLTIVQPIATYSTATTLTAANALVLNNGVTTSIPGGKTTTLVAGVGGINGNALGLITGGGLEVVSSGNVNLANAAHDISTLAGAVTGSGFSFTNANSFAVGVAGGTAGLMVANGDISLTAGGLDKLLTISSNVQATTGSISYVTDNFTATASTTTSGSAGKYAEVKPYTATTSIEFCPLADVANTLRLNGTELSLFSTPMLKVGNVAQTNGIGVNDIVSPGTFSTLSLITGGAITQSAGNTISIPNLNADGFTGVNLPEANNVGSLAGHTNTGNFTFTGANGVNIGQVDINNGITVTTSGNINLTATAGGITQGPAAILSTPTGALTASASTGIGLAAPTNNVSGLVALNSTTGNIAYTASGNIQLGDVIATAGAVSIVSTAGSILDGNAGAPNLSGAAIGLNAATGIGGAGAPLNVAPTASIDALSAGGSIYLVSAGTLPLGLISAPATVSVQSTGASITDGNGVAPNIIGNTGVLSAYSGIGFGNALETQVANLSASNTMVNSIEVNNVGPLTITGMSGPAGIFVDNVGGITTTGAINGNSGNVVLTAHSPLTVGAGGVNGANVTLTAGSPYVSGKTGDDLTINGPVTLSGASGTITLNAGNTIGGSQVPVTAGAKIVVSNPNLNDPVPLLATCIANPLTVGCAAVLPSLATCTATPATPGCAVVLPTLAICTTTPATPGCTAVLPTLATCTTTPATPGCAVVLPTLATCSATPATPGCSAVIPTLATCTATPATPGCSLVLPSLAVCVTAPATPGCSAVLPSVAVCTAAPATVGCSAVLPTLAICISAPSTPGCSAVLPSVASCTANPATPGCSAVLPTLASCASEPAQAGCSAVLPTVATCTVTPSLPGCSAVLPTLSSCASNSTLPGCSAVLPSVAACTANPGAEGCTAVLPSLATCSTNPLLAGCAAVLPTLASCINIPSQPGCSAVLSLATNNSNPTTTNDVLAAAGGAKNLGKEPSSSSNPELGQKLALLGSSGQDDIVPPPGTFGSDSSTTGGGQSGSGDSNSSGGNSQGGTDTGNTSSKEDEGTSSTDGKPKKTTTAKQEKKDAKAPAKKTYCN